LLRRGGHHHAMGKHVFRIRQRAVRRSCRAARLTVLYRHYRRTLLSGFVSDKLGDRKMIIVGTCILLCGVVLLALPIAGYGAAVAAFVVIGVGCAPIYPCIIHSTPANFGAENSGSIIGIQ